MTVQALTTFNPLQFFTVHQGADSPLQRVDTQVTGVAISNDFSGRLSVTTDEGDTITLSADLETDYRAVSYRSSGQSEGVAVDVNVKYVEFSLQREFGVTVEGDLNEQELNDLEKLFRSVSNIFKKFIHGEDEEALAKTVKLADRFERLSSLSSLDLAVDVERSITVLAAQVVSEVTRQPLPIVPSPSAAFPTGTPGGAPSTAAAIPQPSTGTTAPPQPSGRSTDSEAATDLRLAAPTTEDQLASLIQQVFDAIREADLDRQKLEKHLPYLLERVRDDLKAERPHDAKDDHRDTPDVTPSSTNTLLFAYQAFSQTSFSLSVHS